MLRCGGMQFTHGNDNKGEWLKINYYDEDGTSVSERFRLTTPAQRKVFELKFLRQHQRAPAVPFIWHNANDIIKQFSLLRHPDFIVAHKKGEFWQIRNKIFDYVGRYRKADTLY